MRRATAPRLLVLRAKVTLGAVVAWAGLVLLGRAWIEALQRDGHDLNFESAAPLIGALDPHPSWRLVLPIVVGVLTVARAGAVALRLRWRMLLAASTAWSGLWAVVVAVVDADGWRGLTRPLLSRDQYMAEVPSVVSVGEFLRTFADRATDYATHVASHPPGMVLVHALMQRVGLDGLGWAAATYIGVGALAVPAVLVAVRDVADERRAREIAPFVAIAPTAIWIATTADAFFAGVAAWAVTCVVLATRIRDGRSDILASAGGLLFGALAFLSYGLPLIAAIPIAVAVVRKRVRPLVFAASASVLVFGAFWIGGFWWFDGLDVARETFYDGVGGRRPYWVFIVVNWSILAAALGPAIAVGLTRLRDRRLWLLVGSTFAALALASLSGFSRSEVERVWLPFAPWVLVGCAGLTITGREARGWLSLQVAYTIALTTLLVGPW